MENPIQKYLTITGLTLHGLITVNIGTLSIKKTNKKALY
jgi:hypothetical protein